MEKSQSLIHGRKDPGNYVSIPNALHLTHNKSPKSLQPPTRPSKFCCTPPCLYSRTLGPHATSFPGHSTPTTVTTLLALEQSGVFQFLHTYDPFCWSVLPPHRNHFLTAFKSQNSLPQLTFPLLRFIFLHHNIIDSLFCSSPPM